MQFKLLSVVLPLLSLSSASPIAINNEAAGLAAREPTWSPPAGTPSYTNCSFVQQIGLVNVFACNVLNGNTISIPITVSVPISLKKRDAEANGSPPSGSPSYTSCSFVQQIGAANVFLCNVLNGNTLSIPIEVSIPLTLKKREATWSPAPSTPVYTSCSFVQQIGLVNVFACNVLNGNTISIPVSVSVPISLKKREANEPSTSPSPPSPSYTNCSFVQQIGLLNVFLCNVLDGNTISIPISASVPISV